MKKSLFFLAMIAVAAISCSKKVDHPDFDYQTVYFAYQYPVRTITFGEDIFSTELDNQGKFKIMATTGGVYYSKRNVTLDVAVDETLLGNGMTFTPGGNDVLAMPSKYFSLASNKIVIPEGGLTGGVEVQLSNDFFADPNAIRNSYVIPLRITGVSNADSILSNKNFVLYAVKYVNDWHGNYLRRGKDVVTGSVNQTIVRHKPYVEQDEVNKLSTRSRTDVEFPLVVKDQNGGNVNCPLILKFDAAGKCTITAANSSFTATGTGTFVKKGEKNSWGSKDRDALYLSYEVNLPTMKVVSTDTLVARDRAVTMEVFTPVNK